MDNFRMDACALSDMSFSIKPISALNDFVKVEPEAVKASRALAPPS